MTGPSLNQTLAPLIFGKKNRSRYSITVPAVIIMSVILTLFDDLPHLFEMNGITFRKITVMTVAVDVMTSSLTTDAPFISIRAVPVVFRKMKADAAAALWGDVTIVQKIRSSPKSIVPKVA